MLYKLTDAEIRNLCKEKLESLEHWLRRLIDETLFSKYGDYFSCTDEGDPIIEKGITQALEKRMAREPDRYSRKIDAILLRNAVEIICNPKLYKHFEPALSNAFPDGIGEAKTFMDRVLNHRNNLAHANPISLRQAEQIVCYSNDIIDSIKMRYAAVGMQQEYNGYCSRNHFKRLSEGLLLRSV